MGLMRDTLEACWNAVDNWGPLKGSFQTQFRSDAELQLLDSQGVGPAHIGGKAAITIRLQSFNVVPRLQKGIDFPMAFRAEIWNRQDQTRATMDLIEEVVMAWYASRPTPTAPTFLQSVTCGPPQQIVGIEVKSMLKQGEVNFQYCYATATAVFKAIRNPGS